MNYSRLFIAFIALIIRTSFAAPLQEGRDYTVLTTPFPSLHPDKIEIVEAFAYNCAHCQYFEPLVEAFSKSLDHRQTVFRRLHVYWSPVFMNLVRLNLAVEENRLAEQANPLIFNAIINNGINLSEEKKLISWLNAQTKFDGKKIIQTLQQPEIKKKATKEAALTSIFSIDATPTFIVGGRYKLNLAALHNNNDLKRLLNKLVTLAQKNKKPIKLLNNVNAQLCADSL